MLYRIYTEDKNYEKLIDAIEHYFSEFTVLATVGYFHGRCEPGLIIEVGTTKPAEPALKMLAYDIACLNQQECVIVTCIDNEQVVYKARIDTITK